MDVEVSVSDSRAQSRTVTVLKALGHDAAPGPSRMAGRLTVVVTGARADDLSMIHRVVAAVDRPAPVVATTPADAPAAVPAA